MNKLQYEAWRTNYLQAWCNYLENPDDWNRTLLFETAKGCAQDMGQTFIGTDGKNIYVFFWLFRS